MQNVKRNDTSLNAVVKWTEFTHCLSR